MALDIEKTKTPPDTIAPEKTQELLPYDPDVDRKQLAQQLAGSQEIDKLTSEIQVYNLDSITSFGSEAATEIAKCSDEVLRSMSMSQVNDTGKMLTALANIMGQFDIDEIKDEPKGIKKLFYDAKKNLDKIISKYDNMGKQVDTVYVQLKQYEDEIKGSNEKLDKMFYANVGYYHELVKYILAGEQGSKELDELIEAKRLETQTSQDQAIQFDIQSLEQAKIMLDQRTQDLRTAEAVAMQSIPMIRTMQFSNANLIRKINSAFIITLPVFRQALAQAILLKRQKIQAESMAALDQKTNEMLLKNAQNTANQAVMTAQMVSSSSIKIETLEQSWQTIMNGIEETRRIQNEATTRREEDKKKLEMMKTEFNSKYGGMPNALPPESRG